MKSAAPKKTAEFDLEGQFLISMPGIGDSRFARSLIYICSFSRAGAMGFVVNQPVESPDFPELLVQLGVCEADKLEKLSDGARGTPVFQGGPVEQARGFVIHSNDYKLESTVEYPGNICLTATIDILHKLACGEGPKQLLLLLGYAGWSAGQLEREISENGWLNIDASPEIIFAADPAKKYDLALKKLGIDEALLSSDIGHA